MEEVSASQPPKRRRVAADASAVTSNAPAGSAARPPPGEWSLESYEDHMLCSRAPHLGDKCELWFEGVGPTDGAWWPSIVHHIPGSYRNPESTPDCEAPYSKVALQFAAEPAGIISEESRIETHSYKKFTKETYGIEWVIKPGTDGGGDGGYEIEPKSMSATDGPGPGLLSKRIEVVFNPALNADGPQRGEPKFFAGVVKDFCWSKKLDGEESYCACHQILWDDNARKSWHSLEDQEYRLAADKALPSRPVSDHFALGAAVGTPCRCPLAAGAVGARDAVPLPRAPRGRSFAYSRCPLSPPAPPTPPILIAARHQWR